MEKVAKFLVEVSAETKRTFNSRVRFFSQDHGTAKFLIEARDENVLIPRTTISKVEILFESLGPGNVPDGTVIFAGEMTIEGDGLFSYILPDEILGYNGLMAFEIYIKYQDSSRADSSNRIIYEQRVSAIDRVAEQVQIVYVQGMEAAKEEVAEEADRIKSQLGGYIGDVQTASSQAVEDIESQVDQLNAHRDQKINEMNSYTNEVQNVKISAVDTINSEAQRLTEHANQKITEYDQKFQQTAQNIATLDQNFTELRNDMKLSEAWAWSADGTDRFTRDYPNENVLNQTAFNEKGSWRFVKPTGNVSTAIIEDGVAKIQTSNDFSASWKHWEMYINPTDTAYDKIKTLSERKSSFSVSFRIPDITYVPSGGNKAVLIILKTNSGINILEKSLAVKDIKVGVWDRMVLTQIMPNISMESERFRIIVETTLNNCPEIQFDDLKLEAGNASPYVPAPSEDYANAYPQYRGLALLPSDNPADYLWEESAERIKQLAQQETDKLKGEVADIQNWIQQQGGTV